MMEDDYLWLRQPKNGLHRHARQSETVRRIVDVAQLAGAAVDEQSERWPGVIPSPTAIDRVRAAGPGPRPSWAEMDVCIHGTGLGVFG